MQRRTFLLGAATSAGLLATGCSSNTESAEGPSVVRFMVWDVGPEGLAAYRTVIDGFNVSSGGITVEIETVNNNDYNNLLRTRLSGGEGPDVYGVRPQLIPSLIQGEYLEPLGDRAFFRSLRPDAQSNAPYQVVDGKAYVAPLIQSVQGYIWNEEILAEAGVEAPFRNFDDFMVGLEKIKRASYTPLAMSAKDNFFPQFIIYPATAQLVDPVDPQFNAGINDGSRSFAANPQWMTVLENYEQMVPYFMPDPLGTGADAAQAAFLRGEVGIFPQAGLLAQARESGLELGFGSFEFTDSPSPDTWGGYDIVLGINPGNGRSAQAAEFLDYLYSDEVYPQFLTQVRGFPVQEGVDVSEVDRLYADMQASVDGKNIYPSPSDLWLPGIQDVFLTQVQDLTAGRTTPAAVLEAMDQAAAAARDSQ